MDRKPNGKPYYMKIERVALSFSETFDMATAVRNTLYLNIRSRVVDWDTPVLAMPVYLDGTGHPWILPDVRLMMWESPEKMGPVVSACAEKTQVTLATDFAFVTQITHEDSFRKLLSYGLINAQHVFEKLNEFTWMQSVEFRPAWYIEDRHGEAFHPDNGFTIVDYDHLEVAQVFHSPAFRRGLEADLLRQQLETIPVGPKGAEGFHDWVVDTLAAIFFEDLERIKPKPNADAPERRDIVATNMQRSRFWKRLYAEYKVSMPVFEAKNYPQPHANDFRQVYGYLGHQHYGTLGFLVTRSDDQKLHDSSLKQFREMYRKDGIGKLIIVLPSALLQELLNDIVLGETRRIDAKMAAWLEEFLLRHLYESAT